MRAETGAPGVIAPDDPARRRGSRRAGAKRSSRGQRPGALGRVFRRASTWLLAGVVAVSPLLAGSVHRPVVLPLLGVLSLTFFCALAGERLRDGGLRGTKFAIPFVLLVLLPLAQIIPIPLSARRLIDPAGSALLEDAPDGTPHSWPLSLDPSSTGIEIGTAVAALIVFVLSLHDSTRRRYWRIFLKSIALGGIAGVVSGIVHRLAGIERLYGIFEVAGAVLPGPFINPNHSAEFYELAAFAALALAVAAEAELRIAWYVAAAVNAAAALTTLSRGSFLALFAGGAVFLALRLRVDRGGAVEGAPRTGAGPMARTLAWTLGALACLISIAVALGAAPVLDELAHTDLTGGTEKTAVWRDSWTMVMHHPLGIGRHAFDRVYPVYKTLAQNSRFQFVENGPLQLLIDVGWPGVALLALSLVWLVRKMPRRRDYVGAALAAGLVAVLAHNLVDFGLETMGIRLPFAAMAGVMVGRAWGRAEGEQRKEGGRSRWFLGIVIATVAAGMGVGLWAQVHRQAEQIEERWRRSPRGEGRRELAIDGGRRYPTDFYFPLLQSYDERLRPAQAGGVSPRLAALNRALRLCPRCSTVYEQAARALFMLDLRSQALSTYREVIRLAPARTSAILTEADRFGFSSSALATLAVGDVDVTLNVARYLVGKRASTEVMALLAQAESQGAPRAECLLIRGQLLLALGRLDDAESVLTDGLRVAPRDGRFEDMLAQVEERAGRPENALVHARSAAAMSPFSVDFARHWLNLVVRQKNWGEVEEALNHLKVALRQNGKNVTEVHMIAGEVQASRGNLARALSEFRTAAALDATDPATWEAVARTAEARGDTRTAVAAYRRVVALRPDDPAAQQAVTRVEKAGEDAALQQMLIAHPSAAPRTP